MSYQPKEGLGALFRPKERKSDKSPHWSGDVMLNGKMYSIALWEKAGKNGTYLSAKIEKKESKPPVDNTPIPF